MKFGVVQRIIGLLILIFSLTMLPPVAISLIYRDGAMMPFIITFLGSLAVGLLVWYPRRKDHRDMRAREGFLIVVLFWAVLSTFSSMPFQLSLHPHLSFTDAVFETVSALTTTGATVIVGLDHLPHSILWYRQQLQWFGGLGVVVIALAILPILGVGGMQLFRAESSGISSDEKLTPRLKEMVKSFFWVYMGLTLGCAGGYWIGGMSLFDALGHSFATVSTGGFSTHDASMAYFDSDFINIVSIIFMAAGGISFGLHYVAFASRDIRHYWRNSECRTFLLTMMAVAVISTVYLLLTNFHTHPWKTFVSASFEVASIMTSTGFGTEDFSVWPSFLPVLMMFISIMGACVGSTAGGMKTIRFQLVIKQGWREIKRLVHPNAVIPVKHDGRVVSDSVMESIWGFFAAYTILYVILMVLLIATGLDQVSAFSAVAATLNNLGPGLGKVSANFTQVTEFGRWVGIFAMLIGRLEIFTVLVLLTPEFWRD